MAVLAIDQGTSATKALVIDGDGAVLASANVPVTVDAGPGGSVEIDPDDLWLSVLGAAQSAIAACSEPIDAIGLANQGETVLAWDPHTGTALSRAIVWQDSRSSVVCDRLVDHGAELAGLTGLTLDPYFVAPKMTWLRENVTDSGIVTTTDSWLIHRLCGALVTDVSTASRSLLMELDTLAWSPRACQLFEVEIDQLPAIVTNAEIVGETSRFGGSIPIAGLCVDQQAALFAESCHVPGDVKCTYGTGAFLLANAGNQPVRSSNGLVGCAAWQLGPVATWCLDGQVFTAGSAVGWLVESGLLSRPADLDTVAQGATDSGSVMFVPAFAGLGAPFWKPHAKASFVGLGLDSTPAQMVRSVVEGIAAQVAVLARAAASDMGSPISSLRVDGGLTASEVMCQTQSDLLQVPVEVYPSPDATAIGAAAFARIGASLCDAESAVPGWEPVAVYEPQISADEAGEMVSRWSDVAAATAEFQFRNK